MGDLTNLCHEEAEEHGWKILKKIDMQVVAKAVYEDKTYRILKSTKRFKMPKGWIYNISTEIHNIINNTVLVAEAMAFVPDD